MHIKTIWTLSNPTQGGFAETPQRPQSMGNKKCTKICLSKALPITGALIIYHIQRQIDKGHSEILRSILLGSIYYRERFWYGKCTRKCE